MMVEKKQESCEKHGEQLFLKEDTWPGFACSMCIADVMHPLSARCPVHHCRLWIKHSLNKQGYCDKYYELCDVKVSAFGDGRYLGYECIKLKGHKCRHKSKYGLEYDKTEQPKMDFEGGVFRRVSKND